MLSAFGDRFERYTHFIYFVRLVDHGMYNLLEHRGVDIDIDIAKCRIEMFVVEVGVITYIPSNS